MNILLWLVEPTLNLLVKLGAYVRDILEIRYSFDNILSDIIIKIPLTVELYFFTFNTVLSHVP